MPTQPQTADLRAPFPYFGGKSRIAPLVWERFGDVPNYIEPFFGSGAMLLGRPHDWRGRIETVNDSDGFVSNFWRALQGDPESVAHWADWPVNENDLHARHVWLTVQREDITRRLEGDPDWFDTKVAGWWVWGLCQWIGSGWCYFNGPWRVVDGELLKVGGGTKRQLPHLGGAGMGIHRQRPHLGNAGRGACEEWALHLRDTMQALADRLRRVRVCCGDWARVCGPTPTVKQGLTAVFLDPPYSLAERDGGCYASDAEGADIAGDVRAWCLERGEDPRLRIALCGYAGEGHEPLEGAGWTPVAWKAHGGYGSQASVSRARDNAHRERVWFSPHCLRPGAEADATEEWTLPVDA